MIAPGGSRDDDFDEVDDDPLESDMDADSDDLAEMACPSCGNPVVEDTQKCPHCGDWITPVDRKRSARWIYVVAVLIMLALVLMWSR